jgi:putative transposase
MKRRMEFIAEKKGHHANVEVCRVVGVSQNTWYRWQSGSKRRLERDQRNAELTDLIRRIWLDSGKNYGMPKIWMELREEHGVLVSRKKVARLMREADIHSVSHRKYVKTTVPGATDLPDLVRREFFPETANMVWWGDITYIPTDEGWVFLADLIDGYSGKVVGYSFADNLKTELPLAALAMALRERKPEPGLIQHTDRGTQYTSLRYQLALEKAGVLPSMGATGSCFDNAAAESFFALLKKELVHRVRFETRRQAVRAISAYIRWFNSKRRHSRLDYLCPDAFEEKAA